MLAPKQKGETESIQVYPSATGMKTAEYSVQTGDEYRKLQYNARKGYNDNAVFRSEMTSDEIKEILQKKIISHIIISLIPYNALNVGCTQTEDQNGTKQILESFVELVQHDYNNARSLDKNSVKTELDDIWVKGIYEEYGKNRSSLNLSSASSPASSNYM